MKYTQTTLDKIEKIVEECGYIVRYERGSFQSGYCILEQKKVVVLNKFLQLEGRINTLIDLIPQLNINPDGLTPESRKWYDDIMGRYRESVAASVEGIDRIRTAIEAHAVVHHCLSWGALSKHRLGDWDGALEDTRRIGELLAGQEPV